MKTDLKVVAAGKEYPVEISDDDGTFRANLGLVDGSSNIITAPSYEGLVKKAKLVKTSFELPFTNITDDGVLHGTITGIHAGNGNLLVKWDGGKAEQVPSYSSYGRGYVSRLNTDETDEARRLVQARNQAVRALDAFIDARRIPSLKKAAMEAQAKAVEGK